MVPFRAMKEVAEEVSLSVNGQYKVPPGFRFHPTEEELLHYYLRKKVACEKIDLDVIRDVDLNKLEPWDIQEKCKIGSGPQNDWYFFSHKDKKYPTGTRTNRATAAGFWKATGRDKVIHSSLRRIGMRKTLVFYRGRAPHGQKSDWIMHEYRLEFEDSSHAGFIESYATSVDTASEEGWVVCRVFKKKNYVKSTESFKGSSSEGRLEKWGGGSRQEIGNLEEMLNCVGGGCRDEEGEEEEDEKINGCDKKMCRFIHLPPIHGAGLGFYQEIGSPSIGGCGFQSVVEEELFGETYERTEVNHWAALDQLVASQLNGEVDTEKELSCLVESGGGGGLSFCISSDQDALQLSKHEQVSEAYSSECDLWNFNRSSPSSSSDPLSHLSV